MCYILHSCTRGAIFIETRYYPLFSTGIVSIGVSSDAYLPRGKSQEWENFFLFKAPAKFSLKARLRHLRNSLQGPRNPKNRALPGLESITVKPKSPPENPNVGHLQYNVESPALPLREANDAISGIGGNSENGNE
jgi:hypothetical protein